MVMWRIVENFCCVTMAWDKDRRLKYVYNSFELIKSAWQLWLMQEKIYFVI